MSGHLDLSAMVEATWAMPEEMLIRAAPGGDGRTLTGYLVPWDTPAAVVRPIRGNEVYKRGAFTKTLRDRPVGSIIPLLGGSHGDTGPEVPIGRLLTSEDDERGQHGTFYLFNSQAARDAAELVREGVWGGLSIGAYGVPARTRVTHDSKGVATIERSEVVLDHVALLRKPAFQDARVLALRQEEEQDEAALEALRLAVEARRARYRDFLPK